MKPGNIERQYYKPLSYAFCTIAIGEEYLQSAINFANKLNEFSDEHHYVIITKGDTPAIQNTTFVQIPINQPLFIQNIFNYNLKYLPIKISSELGFEYIFFVDSDWKLENEFSTKKINTVISFMETNNYDMLFERPHSIGEGKHDKDNCFWKHKRDFYKLLETDEFDNGHVVNEQFLVFKNSEKLKLFTSFWEKLTRNSTESNVWAFAEGVEIGMSSAKANLNWCYYGWQDILNNCFSFFTKDVKYYKRF